jgi:transposase
VWKPENRLRDDRGKLRYPSDLTDDEWNVIESLIPRARPGGNKRSVEVRAVINGAIHPEHRMPVARDPQGPSATQHPT